MPFRDPSFSAKDTESEWAEGPLMVPRAGLSDAAIVVRSPLGKRRALSAMPDGQT